MNVLKLFGNLRIPIIALVCNIFIQPSFGAEFPNDYDNLILSTRGNLSAEQLRPAIDQLRAWHASYPQELRITWDLAALLDRAGDYQAGVTYFHPVLQAEAPLYAVEAIAHAALKVGQFQDAQQAYGLIVRRSPENIQAQAGYIYALMGQQQLQQAYDYTRHEIQTLDGNREFAPAKKIPLLIALAEIYSQRKDWLTAAATYQQVLQINPEMRYARRQLVFSLSQANVQYLAKKYADNYPDDFDSDEKYQLAHDDGALTIRFGQDQLFAENGRVRFNTADIAISQNDQISETFGATDKNQFDRIVALNERGHMREVLDVYRSLLEANVAIPGFVKIAVADAYLFLQQPDQAAKLYLDSLPELEKGDDRESLLNTRISLVYAYSESGQYDAAEALAERISGGEAQDQSAFKSGLDPTDSSQLRTANLASAILITHSRLDEAEHRLVRLRAFVPFNSDIRATWAALQTARDRPHGALDEFSLLYLDQPDSVDAGLGKADSLLELNELVQAENVLAQVQVDSPENRNVQNFATRVGLYDSPSYRLETTWGNGVASSTADSLTDAYIYSSPIGSADHAWMNDHFRLLAHLETAEGDLIDGSSVKRSRLGVGVDYRASDFTVDAEVSHTLNDATNNGAQVALNWTASDTWHEVLSLDTNVINLPAPALAEGLTAKQLDGRLDWSMNESHKAGAELSSMRFSDDNTRDMAGLWWMNRWISGPVTKLDTVLNWETSHNTETGRAYFNPVRDDGLGLAFKLEWLTWQHYLQSMKQRVDFSVGEYWQSGFNSGNTAGIRYEHEWRLERDFSIAYGLGRNFQPYDGIRQYRDYIYLNLSGHIK